MMMRRFAVAAVAGLLLSQLMACGSSTTHDESDESDTEEGEGAHGSVALKLTGKDPSGTTYRLSNGSFQINGPTTTLLSTDGYPEAANGDVEVKLKAGDYTIALLTGWSVMRVDAGGTTVPMNATLVSNASQSFNIAGNVTTRVGYRFAIGDVIVDFGEGTLDLSISFESSAVPPTTWDPSWSLAGTTFSNGNLSVAGNTGSSSVTVRTVAGKSSGKWYWELRADGGDGATDAGGIGILEGATPNNLPWIGWGPSGLSYGYGACCSDRYWTTWAGVTVNGAPPTNSAIRVGTTYMFALDMDTKRFWTGQNGTWYGGGNPGQGINPVATGLSGTVYPGITFYRSSINAFTANFGASAFTHPVPVGFTAGVR